MRMMVVDDEHMGVRHRMMTVATISDVLRPPDHALARL
jgi:hypothetical protein